MRSICIASQETILNSLALSTSLAYLARWYWPNNSTWNLRFPSLDVMSVWNFIVHAHSANQRLEERRTRRQSQTIDPGFRSPQSENFMSCYKPAVNQVPMDLLKYLSRTDSGGVNMQRHQGKLLNQNHLIRQRLTPGDQTNSQRYNS